MLDVSLTGYNLVIQLTILEIGLFGNRQHGQNTKIFVVLLTINVLYCGSQANEKINMSIKRSSHGINDLSIYG